MSGNIEISPRGPLESIVGRHIRSLRAAPCRRRVQMADEPPEIELVPAHEVPPGKHCGGAKTTVELLNCLVPSSEYPPSPPCSEFVVRYRLQRWAPIRDAAPELPLP